MANKIRVCPFYRTWTSENLDTWILVNYVAKI